jgi:sugar phosphate isomerase/epimerase
MLRVGLNPYGLSYTVGLQPSAPHDRPEPIGLSGFVALSRDLGGQCIELHGRWLAPLEDAELSRMGAALRESGITVVCSDWFHTSDDTLAEAVRCSRAIGAALLRVHLTPVLEGARARLGTGWLEMVTRARTALTIEARRAADVGLSVAVENHQDFTSEELLAIAEEAGGNVGIVFDTGNPFSVGEDPLGFAKRAAGRIRHVHLKDYVAQFTTEGYRLVRCAVGDGCVPLADIAAMMPSGLTASIEPGALEARHIRIFAADWWTGYPPRDARELAQALGRLQRRKLPDSAESRTPWERGVLGQALVDYELDQIRRSVTNLKALGIIGPS